MKTSVKVLASTTGVVVQPTKNPEFFYIAVEQTRMIVDDRGFAKPCRVIAFITGAESTLKSYGFKAGQEISGTIILKESLTAFDKKNPERNFKVAGDTKVVCHAGDAPIYQKYFWNADVNAPDVLLPKIYDNGKGVMVSHSNSDAIRAAYLELKAKTVKTTGLDTTV